MRGLRYLPFSLEGHRTAPRLLRLWITPSLACDFDTSDYIGESRLLSRLFVTANDSSRSVPDSLNTLSSKRYACLPSQRTAKHSAPRKLEISSKHHVL